ncbi:MAG TPA: MFS transporter [Polyangiales bacterium]|nr:MFS transporter [Polyangiales bacterium]
MTGATRSAPQTYSYRWLVLLAFCVLSAAVQVQWLTFAPIAREARAYFAVSALQLDLLSLVFMGVYLLASIPASYAIDTYGLAAGVRIGAALTLGFALARAAFHSSYGLVLLAQIGLAVGQPFVLNAGTKLAGQWFPIRERALAVGLATLSQFIGIIAVMVAMPALIADQPIGVALPRALWLWAGVAGAAALFAAAGVRERPPSPPGPEEPRESMRAGLARIAQQRDMIVLLVLFTLGLGMFNAISTCIDQICEAKGLDVEQTGMVGAAQLIAGVVGAVVLPIASDKLRSRRGMLVFCMLGMLPGLVGLAWARDYASLLIASGLLGFFLLGGGAPIGFQYAAEISHPAPESTSQGLLLMAGQASGIALILAMNALGTTLSLWGCVALGVAIVALTLKLRESPSML